MLIVRVLAKQVVFGVKRAQVQLETPYRGNFLRDNIFVDFVA